MVEKPDRPSVKITALTAAALVAFAANSVLNRLALGENTIDAGSFTAIRLLSGAVVLLIIFQLTRKKNSPSSQGSWRGGLMLFLYAAPFSYAYITLNTGTGALILFGAVQLTILFLSLISGNRLHLAEWVGLVLAFFRIRISHTAWGQPAPVGGLRPDDPGRDRLGRLHADRERIARSAGGHDL